MPGSEGTVIPASSRQRRLRSTYGLHDEPWHTPMLGPFSPFRSSSRTWGDPRPLERSSSGPPEAEPDRPSAGTLHVRTQHSTATASLSVAYLPPVARSVGIRLASTPNFASFRSGRQSLGRSDEVLLRAGRGAGEDRFHGSWSPPRCSRHPRRSNVDVARPPYRSKRDRSSAP